MTIGKRKSKDSEESDTIYTEKYFRDEIKRKGYIPTGSTMLNLGCSNNPFGGYSPGRFTNIIGSTHTGKTILALTCLAVCANDKRFDEYELDYDDVEVANDFDLEYMFGKEFVKRVNLIDPPSHVIEDFFIKSLNNIKKDIPFIDVTDSLDGLTSEAELKRAAKKKRLISDEGKQTAKEKGTYGTEKPRELGEMLRVIKKNLIETKSHLIIISQTRQNIGFGAMFKPLTRSGGDALYFWCFHEIWLSQKKAEEDKGLKIGSLVEAKIRKNKITGKKRDVKFHIWDDLGIDDVGSMVDFLIDNHWKKTKQTIIAPELDLEGTRKKIISYIESENREIELQVLCGKIWNEREESVKLSNRKRRFE